MPLPIAHSTLGFAVYIYQADKFRQNLSRRKRWILLLLLVLATLMPDFDFLFGMMIDRPGHFHHGPSHSLAVGFIIASCIVLLIRKLFKGLPIKKLWMLFFIAAFSHLLLDYLTADTRSPLGVPLFWPFSSALQISPFPLFQEVIRSDASNNAFFNTLINFHNIRGACIETCFAVSFIALILVIKIKSRWQRLTFSVISALSFSLYYFFQIGPTMVCS
jgi:membrane-bound metal-dependent hydrolase YbcI (DUF457 family)